MNRSAILQYFKSKRFFYSICFLMMALVDQQLGSVSDFRQPLLSRGVMILVLLLSLSHWLAPKDEALPPLKAKPLFIILFGLFVILALFSKHNDGWILLHFGAFIIFYITPFSLRERRGMLAGLQDGLIVSFFLIQGLAFVFRPYDVLRYPGMYANTNINALYYVIVYSALLGRVLTMKKGTLKILHVILCCSMWSFVLLTMCRSAFLGMGALTILALFYKVKQNLRLTVKQLPLLVCTALLCFPLVYGAVRYIPPLFHHPIWFLNEYSEDRVHSFDPIDSPKYTHWLEVLEGNFGRILLLKEGISTTETSPSTQAEASLPDVTQTEASLPDAAQTDIGRTDVARADLSQESADELAAASPSPELNSASARITIYRHYLQALNLWGHTEAENGVQITSDYFAPHAHDLFLQYFFHFGIPAGIIFLVFMVLCGLRLLYLAFFPEPSPYYIIPLLTWAGVMVFGLTEMMWRMGQLSFMLMFLLPLWAVLPAHNVAFPHNQNS